MLIACAQLATLALAVGPYPQRGQRERAAEAMRARQEVQQERVRIARELHDVVAHTLAVMTVQAGVGRRLAAKRPDEANVVKHAPGAHASVDLTISAKDVRIEVADDGGTPAGSAASPGHDGRPAIRGTGHGILGMRERIGAFGGWLAAEPLAADGFHVLAEVPVEGPV